MKLKIFKDKTGKPIGYATEGIDIVKNKETPKVERVNISESMADRLIKQPDKVELHQKGEKWGLRKKKRKVTK